MPGEFSVAWADVRGGFSPAKLLEVANGFVDGEVKKFNADTVSALRKVAALGSSFLHECTEPNGPGHDETFGKGGAETSQFALIGSKQKKGKTTLAALTSSQNAMGLDKTYKEKKDDAKRLSRIASGVGKKSKDPLSAGDRDSELVEQMAHHREIHRVSPNGVKASPDMAAKLGHHVKEAVEGLMSARTEDVNPHHARILNNLLDGQETFGYVPQIDRGLLTETIAQAPDFSIEKAKLVLGKEAVEGPNAVIKPHVDAPKPGAMMA